MCIHVEYTDYDVMINGLLLVTRYKPFQTGHHQVRWSEWIEFVQIWSQFQHEVSVLPGCTVYCVDTAGGTYTDGMFLPNIGCNIRACMYVVVSTVLELRGVGE